MLSTSNFLSSFLVKSSFEVNLLLFFCKNTFGEYEAALPTIKSSSPSPLMSPTAIHGPF